MRSAKLFSFFVILLLTYSSLSYAQISSAQSGNWNDGATWVGGVVPGASDDVIISNTVTVDISNAACNNLTIADGGRLYFDLVTDRGIIINGSCQVDSNGRVQAAASTPSSGQFYHTIELKKDLTISPGGRFDMRNSSGSNLAVVRVLFSGTTNSTINLALNTYTSNTEEFNSVEINKTGGAKVILNSGTLFQNNNTSNGPDTLVLTSGVIETGSNHWVTLRTSSAAVLGASNLSYINGILGHGVSNGGGLNDVTFNVGDGTQYRPVTVSLNAPANATGHYVWGTLITGNANTGSSAFLGDIDKVSEIRYYEVGYLQNAGSASAMPIYRMNPTYSTDDGVNAGNTDLRVAYSTDSRATWVSAGPTGHTTDLTTPPTTIASDSLDPAYSINTGTSMFVALGRASGTSTNPLPVELKSFSASYDGNSVHLNWVTATEINNKGFDIERGIDKREFEKIGFVSGSGTTTEQRSYSFIDKINSSGEYFYRLKQIDQDGSFKYSNVINADIELPINYSLSQNYPNPFNPATSIKYQLPEAGFVTIKVYDILGNEVMSLINQQQESGSYTITADFSGISSGTYIYELKVNSFTQRNKMLLMK